MLKWEGVIVCGNAVERGLPLVHEILVLLAGCASFDVFGDPLSHAFPRSAFVLAVWSRLFRGVLRRGDRAPLS